MKFSCANTYANFRCSFILKQNFRMCFKHILITALTLTIFDRNFVDCLEDPVYFVSEFLFVFELVQVIFKTSLSFILF